MEIQKIVAGDGQIVAEYGSILTVIAEVIRYSEETRHLFEEAEMLVYHTEGGVALVPELKRGWRTYNFTVVETHTYIADGARVHNESVLSSLKAGDVLLTTDVSLSDAAALRDTNGDGRQEVVLIDGVKYGGNTIVIREFTYTAPTPVSNVANYVKSKMAQIDGDAYTTPNGNFRVDIYGTVFDPGRGNGPNDGRVSDDMDEMLTNDLGFTRVQSATRYIEIASGFSATEISRAVSGTTLLLYLTNADGTVETVPIPSGADITSVRLDNGTSIPITSVRSTTPSCTNGAGRADEPKRQGGDRQERDHYDSHDQVRAHLADFLAAYNFARRLKTLNDLTPYEYICKIWTSEPERFILDPIHLMPELND